MTTSVAPSSAPSPAPRRRKTASRLGWAVLIVLLVVAAVLGGWAYERFFGATAHTSDTQIYQSVQREEKVSLLALGIQGIEKKTADGKILGVPAPAADRTTLIQYQFTARVGIDGEKVTIVAGDTENAYVISIPEFIFIGYDDPHFEDAIESNGPLSFLTEEVEVTQMINTILSDENQQAYIEDHEQTLRDQAQAYYTGIIASIDPDATVTFEFAQ